MSQQDQGPNNDCNTEAEVSLYRVFLALHYENVEEIHRLFQIQRSLVNKPIYNYYAGYTAPPLVFVLRNSISKHKVGSSGRHVQELVGLVRVLLDLQADMNATDDRGWSAWHYAVEEDIVELVELFLQYHAEDVAVRDKHGYVALIGARSVDVARLLIAHGAHVNIRDDRGITPLHYSRSVEMARFLVANEADVNSKDNDGYPIWFYGIAHWDLDLFNVLIDHGVNLNTTWGSDGVSAVHVAAVYGNLEMMEYLLDQGVDVNARTTAGGATPLHFAGEQSGHPLPLVQLLLERGADVNATDHDGRTPFASISCRNSDPTQVAKLLIANGAVVDAKKVLLENVLPLNPSTSMVELILEDQKVDLNARDSSAGNNETLAFQMLDVLANHRLAREEDRPAHQEYRPIFMLLIERGADIKARHRQSGRTLLHFAVAGYKLMDEKANCDEFVSEIQLLLENGSDVNAADNKGWTPLLYASYYGHWNIARILVDHGADVNIAEGTGEGTPLSWACMRNDESMVQLLLNAGAQVDYRLKDGVTALLLCVGKGFVGCATWLVEHAADQNGYTPFLLACKQAKLDMIYCLVRASPHHRRRGLLSQESYPRAASVAVDDRYDLCDGHV